MSFGTISGLSVISYLAGCDSPATSREISEATGVPRATVYRTVNELVGGGWLTSIGSPQRFAASWRVAGLGLQMLARNHLRNVLLRSLIEFGAETRMPVYLSFPDGADSVQTDLVRVVGGGRIMPEVIHSRTPLLLGATGRSILANRPPVETERLIEAGVPHLVPTAPGGPEYCREQVEYARRVGFGVCDAEVDDTTLSIAAAVLDEKNDPVAAMGLAVSPLPRRVEVERTFGDVVQQWGLRASMELGHRPAAPIVG